MRRLAVLLAAVLLAAWLALAPTAAEPPADAFVEAVPLGDFSEGLAFAHITRPDGTQADAYITADGQVACTLPEGYDYGYPFHEGYAVVRTLPRADGVTDFFTSETGDFASLSFLGARHGEDGPAAFNLIDTAGNLLFTGGPYRYLGAMGNGRLLAWVEEADGVQALYWLDAAENATLITRETAVRPTAFESLFNSRYTDGIAILREASPEGGQPRYGVYDTAGNRLFEFGAVDGGASGLVTDPKFTTFLVQYVDHEHTDDPEGIVIYATYDRPTNTLTPLQTFEDSGAGWFRIRQDPDAAPFLWQADHFTDGRNLMIEPGGFRILDTAWQTVVQNTALTIERIEYDYTGYDGHWIVALPDGYTLLSTEGELAFAPQPSPLAHLGEGLIAAADGSVRSLTGRRFSACRKAAGPSATRCKPPPMRRWAACSVKATPPYRRIPAPAFGSAWTAAPCTPAAILPLTRHGCLDIKSIEIKSYSAPPQKTPLLGKRAGASLSIGGWKGAGEGAAVRREGKRKGDIYPQGRRAVGGRKRAAAARTGRGIKEEPLPTCADSGSLTFWTLRVPAHSIR